jgi:hypothetical protein
MWSSSQPSTFNAHVGPVANSARLKWISVCPTASPCSRRGQVVTVVLVSSRCPATTPPGGTAAPRGLFAAQVTLQQSGRLYGASTPADEQHQPVVFLRSHLAQFAEASSASAGSRPRALTLRQTNRAGGAPSSGPRRDPVEDPPPRPVFATVGARVRAVVGCVQTESGHDERVPGCGSDLARPLGTPASPTSIRDGRSSPSPVLRIPRGPPQPGCVGTSGVRVKGPCRGEYA